MGRWFKYALALLVYRSGLLVLWWLRRRAPRIVMYHRVLEPEVGADISQPGIVVSTPTFDRQLRLLERWFDVRPLAEVVAANGDSSRSAARPPCAITFDDGWRDNHRCALPVLESRRLPATIFLATGYIGTQQLFWPERVVYILSGSERERICYELLDGASRSVVKAVLAAASAPEHQLGDAIDHLIEALKELDDDSREALIEVMMQATGRDPGDLEARMLDWSEVNDLAARGVEIGSHTVSHAILTRVDRARLEHEVRSSREQLTGVLGTAPESFAYPNGDWSPEVARAVEDAGYARAVTTESEAPRSVHTEHHPFAAVRKNLSEGSSRGPLGFSESVFACEVLGFFDALRQGRRWD